MHTSSVMEVRRVLLADRFVRAADGDFVDLASGDRVHVIISRAGEAREQARWAERCARLARLRHRSIAVLVDYGALGAEERFEAWRCGPHVREGEDTAVARAARFLEGCALSVGTLSLHAGSPGTPPVAVPGHDTGYERPEPATAARTTIDVEDCGLELLPRRAVDAVCAIFAGESDRARAVALWGGRDAGLATALRVVARTARLQGYVPIAVRHSQLPKLDVLDGRTLLLIATGEARHGWPALVWFLLRTARPHVLLLAGEQDVRHAPVVPLQPFTSSQLEEALRPACVSDAIARRVRDAAEHSKGQPGRFAQLLWGRASRPPTAGAERVLRVAETPVRYDAGRPAAAPPPLAPGRRWPPAPLNAETGRRRLDTAVSLLAQGRRAPAERLLRQAIGELARRDNLADAARGTLALAGALLGRGRLEEAGARLDQAKEWATASGQNDLLLQVGTLAGTAALDALRLDEAQSILGGVVSAARGQGHAVDARAASIALARCLFWRGQYADACAALAVPECDGAAPGERVRMATLRARIAVGMDDLIGATTALNEARRAAGPTENAALLSAVAAAAAFVHLAIGDAGVAEQDAAAALSSARAARDTLRGARARLLGAEALRRLGKAAAARAACEPVFRLAKAQVPPILRERCRLLEALLARGHADAVVHRAAATGLKALSLFVPPVARPGAGGQAPIGDLLDILGCCQTAEEDATLLAAVCARLRSRLHASGVAFFVDERGNPVQVVHDGARPEPEIARRATAIDQVLAPHRTHDRIEGAAPVRYGGRRIGSLVAQWTIASQVDAGAAGLLLATAATAAAPAVAALAAARAAPPSMAAWELLGGSSAVAAVRRAIERAAAAPFAVLVEGESGSGKELVARALHRRGPRRERPFCAVNCAALPDDLLESELFGHARGAFTGAVAERTGVFEEANGGTLLLDEIGELSLRAQAKVLRTIQEGEVRRVGDNASRRVDVRLVAATNRDLRQEVAGGRFRLDLLYRLDVIRIVVPPLRDRRDDIPVLADHFWREAAARVGSKATLASATFAALARYDWPGNVRELQNVLASLAVRSPRRGVVGPEALPPFFDGARPDASWRLEDARKTFERRFVKAALARAGGHRTRAAEELGVTRQGLTKLMARLGIAELS